MSGKNFSRKEKILGICTFSLAASAFLYLLVIEPVAGEWIRLERQVQTKKASLAKSARLLADHDRIETEYAGWSKNAKASAFKEEDVVSALDELEKVAKDTSVFIAGIKPQNSRESEGSRQIVLDVSAEAGLEGLSKFLYEIENKDRLFRVKRLTVTAGSKDATTLKCNFLISKILID